MTKNDLLASIISDLGANYNSSDNTLLNEILEETIADALRISNRKFKSNVDDQLDILASDIRRCVKSLYLQRGTEDVSNQTMSGLSSSYDNAKDRMRMDIIKGGKRIML